MLDMFRVVKCCFNYTIVCGRSLVMVSLFLMSLGVVKSSAAVITVENNKSLSLCQELKQILEEPVNEQGKGYNFRINPEFHIPKKYSNFSLLNWNSVDVKDLKKYILSEERIFEIERFNKSFKGRAQMLIQKARVDINHDGVSEIFIRYKSSNIDVYDNYKHRKWNYYVSDIGENSSDISKTYSARYGYMDGIFSFYYKGRFYQSNRYVPSEILVYETTVVDPKWIYCKSHGKKCDVEYKNFSSLGMILACHVDIKLTRRELTNMGYDSEYVDKYLKVYFNNH